MKYAMNYGKKMDIMLIQRVNLVMIVTVIVIRLWNKFLSGSKHSDSFDDNNNVNDDSDMQHGTWTKVGAEWPHFPFSGKPVDLEDPDNLLDYCELLITPELVKLISRETYQCTQQFLENVPNLKKSSRVHHWNNTNRREIMKLLAFLLLQGFD
jgi:hypothetical protein